MIFNRRSSDELRFRNSNGEVKHYLDEIRKKIKILELNGRKDEADKLRVQTVIKLAKACVKKNSCDNLTLATIQWILHELPRIKLDGTGLYEYEGRGDENEQKIIVFEIPEVRIQDVKGKRYREIATKLVKFLKITKTELGQRPEAEREGRVLLHGPTGTGKTHIAQAIANELGIPASYVVTSLIWQKYVGDSEKYLMNIFQRTIEEDGMIIIDEFDALVQNRDQTNERVALSIIGLLLQLLIREKPIVITITNKPWLIDEAILDRFDEIIYVPPPDDEARMAIFRYYLFEKFKIAGFPESDLQYLADLTKPKEIGGRVYYYTARNIVKIVKKASFMAREKRDNGKVTLHDLRIAIRNVRLQVNEDVLKKYEEFDKNIF
jgi:transitional endoplasmic reticulum ATPase